MQLGSRAGALSHTPSLDRRFQWFGTLPKRIHSQTRVATGLRPVWSGSKELSGNSYLRVSGKPPWLTRRPKSLAPGRLFRRTHLITTTLVTLIFRTFFMSGYDEP